MPRYLISFDDGWMNFPEEELPDVAKAPLDVVKEVIGGFAVVDVPSRQEALEWAAKIAAACRCAQEVRELLPDPRGLEQDVPLAPSARSA